MTRRTLPLSGYAIGKVYATAQELRHQPATLGASQDVINFGWDWRQVDDRTFEVRIVVSVGPTERRDSFFSTDVVGRFRRVTEAPAVSQEDFVRLQAVALLLPYARQFLSNLTANSVHGTYYLPTVNVTALMQDFDVSKATGAGEIGEPPKPRSPAAKKGRQRQLHTTR
jgi:preprotein translocase subunit SecB